MSLIDEALKRARDEAARQEEAHRREKRPWLPPPPKKPRRTRSLAIAAVFAAVALGAAWLLTAGLRTKPPAAKPAAPHAALPPAGAGAPPRRDPAAARWSGETLETVEVPPPPGKPAPRATAPAPAPPPAATPRAKASPRIAAAPPDRPASPPAAPGPPPAAASAPSRSPARAAAAALHDGKSFVRVVALPSGEKIELGGIVWSDANPVALIGGRVLAPGAWVGDFQLVNIEQDRVTLHGRGVTIYITLS